MNVFNCMILRKGNNLFAKLQTKIVGQAAVFFKLSTRIPILAKRNHFSVTVLLDSRSKCKIFMDPATLFHCTVKTTLIFYMFDFSPNSHATYYIVLVSLG